MNFVLDIKEKDVGAVKAPSFPQPKPAGDGFPQHKKRTRVSAFKQKHQGTDSASSEHKQQQQQQQQDDASNEKRRIDQENSDLLASMSPEQIEEERRELLERLDPSIVQMLLKRANIDDHTSSSPFDEPSAAETEKPPTITVDDTTAAAPSARDETADKPRKTVRFDEDAAPPEPPSDLFEATSQPPPTTTTGPETSLSANTTHFPQPKQVPDLDPADPDFLENLHQKYFPSLPADPSKLAWMAPIPTPHSTADRESPYYPGQTSLPISALRFDFKGRLLSPARSRSIPVSKGLHHHGEAPEAAGYTVGELGRLARSAVPAQRCVAFQTLGRILYRLGKGEWGSGGGESELARGIWATAQENRVIDSLLEAAEVPEGQGHRGSRAYAIEALWLFEKGGWKEQLQGR
ncbi:hypothetical protein M406DRAFT_99539 [Cryphonectria parasitica EP155]|uniref:RNA polymerase II-associated protein RBA50 n=1 Tax=Cryphonectria parasitica (strain ATCC 38755 / EP155) TaxID=660469 RepID=A0A9P4XY19_CRYP1|nr:uncharacterized protein M406DRAFT_99539 [Cryphonectria parasitica EP155]KAF3763019.1 hypothetical protein M406DRAFT_99539 [Cryphonectria parasitica EP155]